MLEYILIGTVVIAASVGGYVLVRRIRNNQSEAVTTSESFTGSGAAVSAVAAASPSMAVVSLLIMARNSGAYFKGDVVEVRESNAPRGEKEGPPMFCWVEVSDVTDRTLMASFQEPETITVAAPDGPEQQIVKRRAFTLDVVEVDMALAARDGIIVRTRAETEAKLTDSRVP